MRNSFIEKHACTVPKISQTHPNMANSTPPSPSGVSNFFYVNQGEEEEKREDEEEEKKEEE